MLVLLVACVCLAPRLGYVLWFCWCLFFMYLVDLPVVCFSLLDVCCLGSLGCCGFVFGLGVCICMIFFSFYRLLIAVWLFVFV